MSPRQATTSLAEVSETTEGSIKSKGLKVTSQRNSRRSNSAMSSARTRGSVSKDEVDSEQQQKQQEVVMEESSNTKDENMSTAEAEEEDEDNGGSGESNNSVPQSSIRGRRKPGGKRRRGGGAASSRARQSRMATSNVSVEEEGKEETIIKNEADDETAAAAAEGKESDDVRQDVEGGLEEDSTHTRQRSASGLKELAGLGLRSIGDGGEGEPLVPRRTRRSVLSPNASRKEDDDNEDEEGQEIHQEDIKGERATEPIQSQHEHSDDEGGGGAGAVGEDNTTEEGVTRCLCGSSDENVGLMIQCETCKCWQHCICMGMRTEEDCPDVYFCEQCRPELHVPLLRLLGVLPTSRNGKRNGSKSQSGRLSAKDAAKELKEAKEAVLNLAKENEKRRKEGREPVTGWSIAQEQEHQNMLAQQELMQQQQGGGGGQQRRQMSESRTRTSRSQSGDDLSTPKSPPKRRSTMNSRDSAYGWESIPSGLLNEEDERGSKDESEGGGGRKRSRVGQGDERERQSASPIEPSSSDGSTRKRRRMSSNVVAREDRFKQKADEEEEEEGITEEISNSQTMTRKASKGRVTREQESKPKHPNQYTARRAAAAAAAAAAVAAASGTIGSSSLSPSPSKNRLADGTRKTTSLRDVVNYEGDLTPTASQMEFTKTSHPSTSWGMPDHLSHLSYLLPTPIGPDPLRVNLASTKGMPSTFKDKTSGHHSNAIKDSKTDRIIQASPQPFQILSLVEPNTKIKFPGKRTTMGEMKKRVRNILEFVSRLQIESVERERRMKFLGIAKESNEVQSSSTLESENVKRASQGDRADLTSAVESVEQANVSDINKPGEGAALSQEQEKDTEMKDADAIKVPTDGPMDEAIQALAPFSTSSPSTAGNIVEGSTSTIAQAEVTTQLKRFTELDSTSMSLVDELTRELLSFQQRYGTGTSIANTAIASSTASF